MTKRVFALICLLLVALILVACSSEEPTPALPTLAPTAEPVEVPTDTPVPEEPSATPEEPQVEEDVWERIQASGKVVVGTSADYPPFEFYTPDFQLEGLDMAIIREIGDRLGLEVEIRDFAFEGLGAALALEQIDVAIAGISITPERLGEFDFSDVYFVSEDAFLAREDALVTVNAVEDLANYRVGVQAGTVYEDWLEESLVETGLIAPENLAIFVDTEAMIGNLEVGFVDVLVADKQPAEEAKALGPYEIVGGGLKPQLFAIAMPKDAGPLQAEINDALAGMKEDGTLFELIETYLNLELEEILPPGTELPGAVAPSPPDCLDGMAWIADLNLDDQNMTAPPPVNPGEPFQKGWRIQNVGTCTWDSNYKLGYLTGNVPAAQMGGEATFIQGTVGPSQSYDMWLDLVAPITPGVYQGIWQMFGADNQPFGQRLWVGINVPPPATPTPEPTQTPMPGFQFIASPSTIQQGQCTTLIWQTSNVQAVYVYEQGQPWQNYGVPGSGQRTACPSTTTVYEMRVVNPDNSVVILQALVNVSPVSGAPVINTFSVKPNPMVEGQCLEVKWQVSGPVSQVTIVRNKSTLVKNGPVSGSTVDCPEGTSEKVYILEAKGPDGTSNKARTVPVIPSTSPPPQPTPTSPAPQPPVVDYFSVEPSQVTVNGCVTIAWGASGGTTNVKIKRDGKTILDNAPFEGNAQECLSKAGPVLYEIIASNNAGAKDRREQAVVVGDIQPANPLAKTTWELRKLNGQDALLETVVIAFFSKGGNTSGSGGCNPYNGKYVANGSSLSISALSSGKASCGGEVDAQEQAYLSALQSAASFVIDGNNMAVLNGSGQEILRFRFIK